MAVKLIVFRNHNFKMLIEYSLMMHRDEIKRTVLSVDMCNKLGHLSLKFRGVRKSWRSYLYKNDIANPLRVIAEQLFKCTELITKGQTQYYKTLKMTTNLLKDTFHNVELVTTYNDFFPLVEGSQSFKLRLNSWSKTASRLMLRFLPNNRVEYSHISTNSLGINANWTVTDSCNMAFYIDAT